MASGPLTYSGSQEITGDVTGLPAGIGYRCNADGTLRARLVGDSAARDWTVLGGVDYAGDLADVTISASVGVTKVWHLRRTGKVLRS